VIYDGYNNKVKEENIVGTITQHCSRDGLTNGFKVIKNNNVRRLTPIECERLQGFPDNWTKNGMELGEISDTQRYKMCGNAVTVDVVEAVAKKIKESL
jgi:DNA (cytosine-5)-methyltransferase 1